MWWIRASIQEYILRSWSLVKMGTTAAQKRLFFGLRKAKGQIEALDEGDMRPDQVKEIARKLGVKEDEVVNMNRRLSGDASLNVRVGEEGDSEWQDWLADDELDQETRLADAEELDERRTLLAAAMEELPPREREILEARRLRDEPVTLEDLAKRFGISRERVRQIEVKAFAQLQEKMRAAMTAKQTAESEILDQKSASQAEREQAAPEL
jgi:RNA polymerase sigma-32 factor